MKIAVVGIGNVLMGDEGAGVHAVHMLRRAYQTTDAVILIDGGTIALDLLPFIEGLDGLLIVDAVNAGKAPGELVCIEGEEVPSYLAEKLSVHQIGVPDLLFSARLIGTLPGKLCLIGMQPGIVDVGITLSAGVEAVMDSIVQQVANKLREWGAALQPRENDAETSSLTCPIPEPWCMDRLARPPDLNAFLQ